MILCINMMAKLGETALLFRENVKNYAKYVFNNERC